MDILEVIGIQIASPVQSGSALSAAQFTISIIRNGLILFFAAVVIIAIVYAGLAGIKFIRSEGASDQVEEARNSITYTLLGVAVAFIGIIAVVLVSSAFAPNTATELSLRCTFGDFELCRVSQVGSGETCPSRFEDLCTVGEIKYCIANDVSDGGESEAKSALNCT